MLALGDSALATLGGCHDNALDLLERDARYDRALHIDNGCVVGMTSADARIHFDGLSRTGHYAALILYLGNCDACGFGPVKPYTPLWLGGWPARRASRRRQRDQPFARRNPPFAYRDLPHVDEPPSRCVSPADHARHLRKIVQRAERVSMPVVLIVPASKPDFPPCNNTGNHLYYRLVNVPDRLGFPEDEEIAPLLEAYAHHREGELERARSAYRSSIESSVGWERRAIAANNLAAVEVELGDTREARALLERASTEGGPLRAMALFNLGVLLSLENDPEAAERLFEEAREADTGTYRVTGAYQEVMRQCAEGQPGVRAIDCASMLSPAHFVDYCHPTSEGHRILSQHVREALESLLPLVPGAHAPAVRSLPLHPDSWTGARGSFWDLLGIVPDGQDEGYGQALIALAGSVDYAACIDGSGDPLEPTRRRMQLRMLRHPLFGCREVLERLPPAASCDRGRLPELYVLRHSTAWMAEAQRSEPGREVCERLSSFLPDPARLGRWRDGLDVPPERRESEFLLAPPTDLVREVASRVATLMARHLEAGPVQSDRYRTISFWFLREALLFGTPSHHSQLCDRTTLFDLAGACVWGLVVTSADAPEGRDFRTLTELLCNVAATHAEHLEPFATRLYAMDDEARERYRAAMSALRSDDAWSRLEVSGPS